MRVMSMKPGHDGAIAVVEDHDLVLCVEPEKGSGRRHSSLTPSALAEVADQVGGLPDVVALGGWNGEMEDIEALPIGAGYSGVDAVKRGRGRFFGREVVTFSSSHERSHIMMAIGMAPSYAAPIRTVLVWEGDTGGFVLVGQNGEIKGSIPVMSQPGGRYSLLYALADPTFLDSDEEPRLSDAGKLMALAAYGDASSASGRSQDAVAQILALDTVYAQPKLALRDSPLHNAGVESEEVVNAAALLSRTIFEQFAAAARQSTPEGSPLLISGGCGLNCDWNTAWHALGHHSSVFVPPCPNDSGSAIGTAADALLHLTGEPRITWDVYRGLDFWDDGAPTGRWKVSKLDLPELARALASGRIVAWVQGRWEIGPRALGNRSILAEPSLPATKNRLNLIKKREAFRPIAPCCRVEDLGAAFVETFEDPHMLHFRQVRELRLEAIAHVDGSARVQTVSAANNVRLHALLTAVADVSGLGVLCNTSLNRPGRGFINRMSDLAAFCDEVGIDDFVVGDSWYQAV